MLLCDVSRAAKEKFSMHRLIGCPIVVCASMSISMMVYIFKCAFVCIQVHASTQGHHAVIDCRMDTFHPLDW